MKVWKTLKFHNRTFVVYFKTKIGVETENQPHKSGKCILQLSINPNLDNRMLNDKRINKI